MATGNGVFKGDAVFALADGSFVDKDGKEVAAALPALPSEEADGYKLADQDTKKIYTLATVEETQTWGDGVALAAGKLYTDGTDIYVFGSGSLAKI